METVLPMFESATGNKVKIRLKAGPAILDWAEGFFAAMQPFNAGEVYVNSLDQGEVHRVREAYRIKLRPVGSTQSEIRPDQFLSLQSKYPSPIAAENGRQPERWRMVQGIDNIGICTTDLSRSVAFYDKLGLSEAYRNDRGVMMAAGTVQLFLFQVRRPDPAPVGRELGLFGNPPGIDHISFAVADVNELYAELCKAGVAFAAPPEDQSWGARMVGLKDPDGNNLYLLQRF